MPSIFKGRGKPLTMEVLEQRYMNGQVDDEHSSLDKRRFYTVCMHSSVLTC